MELPLVVCVMAVWLAAARAQPFGCDEDVQCSHGAYCDPELHSCNGCIICADLKREPPSEYTPCVKSVRKCGPCFKGLVEDSAGDGGLACVLGEARDHSAGLPTYAWAIIGICLLVFMLFVVAVLVYILRNTDTFKILASTRTSVEAPGVSNGVVGSPQPPPYNAHYAPVWPSSPPALNAPSDRDDESSLPLVKREPPAQPNDARESADRQAALVYSNPAYVRGPQLPPSYEFDTADSEEPDHGTPSLANNRTPFVDIDENTTNRNDVTVSDNTAAALSETQAGVTQLPELRRASRSDIVPVTKAIARREDTNNNRDREGGGSGTGDGSGGLPTATSVVINVVNVNTVQQLNDVSL